jgi:hypothetical protein
VAFTSCNNYTGQNWDFSTEVFAVGLDGTGMVQLTQVDDSYYKLNRIDDAGTWVVFQSPSNFDGQNPSGVVQVLRVRSDGTGLQRITTDTTYGGSEPDISGAGDRIVYSSAADPLGTNADHSTEIFVYEPGTATTRQLTSTSEGGSSYPRISAGGAWVYFKSSAPFFERNPDGVYDAYRVPATGGAVERAGALRSKGADLGIGSWRTYVHQLVVDADGNTAAFTGPGDWAGTNPDADVELYLVDQAALANLYVSQDSPTVVSWDAEPRYLRYDVVRGDVADLSFGAGDTVDLSLSVCLVDDLPDIATAGHEDPTDPSPGQAFFYLRRGSQGMDVAPQSWGEGTGGKERVNAACGP